MQEDQTVRVERRERAERSGWSRWHTMGMFAAVMALHAACSINEPKGGDEPPVPAEPSLDTQLQELLSAQGVGPAEQPAAQDPRLVELGLPIL